MKDESQGSRSFILHPASFQYTSPDTVGDPSSRSPPILGLVKSARVDMGWYRFRDASCRLTGKSGACRYPPISIDPKFAVCRYGPISFDSRIRRLSIWGHIDFLLDATSGSALSRPAICGDIARSDISASWSSVSSREAPWRVRRRAGHHRKHEIGMNTESVVSSIPPRIARTGMADREANCAVAKRRGAFVDAPGIIGSAKSG